MVKILIPLYAKIHFILRETPSYFKQEVVIYSYNKHEVKRLLVNKQFYLGLHTVNEWFISNKFTLNIQATFYIVFDRASTQYSTSSLEFHVKLSALIFHSCKYSHFKLYLYLNF